MKKKLISGIILAVLFVGLSFGIISCADDSDDSDLTTASTSTFTLKGSAQSSQ
jgi:hypothetical protein